MAFISSVQIREMHFDNDVELRNVARIYASVPLDWDPSFQVTDADINYHWFKEKRESLKCFVALIDDELIGIHILQKQSHRPEACFIKTLWVSPIHRDKGIANLLRTEGESWAKEQGRSTLVTNVMIQNSRMLEINKRKGFVSTKLEMEKKLI